MHILSKKALINNPIKWNQLLNKMPPCKAYSFSYELSENSFFSIDCLLSINYVRFQISSLITCVKLDPVVQSIVSLTSSLSGQLECFTSL